MSNIKKFEEYEINEGKKGEEKSLTAEEFLFERYKKYYPDANSFEDFNGETLPMSRVAKLMEEYYKEKTK